LPRRSGRRIHHHTLGLTFQATCEVTFGHTPASRLSRRRAYRPTLSVRGLWVFVPGLLSSRRSAPFERKSRGFPRRSK
jgi:hypothetical protein